MNETRLRDKLRQLPDKPGVYVMKDEGGRVIYVGKASSLRNRVRSYFHKGHISSSKTLTLVSKVHDIDWLVTTSELEALMLECNLIKQYRPRYNVRLRDDKHYPYICVTTSENFPRAVVVRRVKEDGNRYFGPFADSATVRESLRLIRKVFRLRGCSKKLTGAEHDRPCLNFRMSQCESPCSGRISAAEYAQLVKDACLFLEGKIDSIIKRLNEEMIDASEALEFERAGRIRDQIQALQKVGEYQQAIRT
ncbi:MAG: excinuclease ABC subunit UvrC, partial [Armatimonadota bacterium]